MQIPQLEHPSEKGIIAYVYPRFMFSLAPAGSGINLPWLILLDAEPLCLTTHQWPVLPPEFPQEML